MSYMFGEYSSLSELDLSCFNTNNVTNMIGMLYGCYSLIKFNISNFNITPETKIGGMFSKCTNELKMKIREKTGNIGKEASY